MSNYHDPNCEVLGCEVCSGPLKTKSQLANTKRKYELQGLSNLNKKQRKHYEELTNGKYPHCYFCNDLEPPYQTVRVKGSELELCQECGYLLIKELEIF